MPIGRPSGYTKTIADLICAGIAGGQPLRTVCAGEDMPAMSTIFKWLGKHKEFSDKYAQACTERAEWLAEDLIEIADNGSNDWMANNDPENPGYRTNGEHIQRSRLRVDTRKWLASKMYPKKYGDKVETTLRGDPTAPIALVLNGSDVNG